MEGRPDLLRASPSRIWMARKLRMGSMQHLSGLKDKWLAAIAGAGALDQLENLRVEALGKKGEVTDLMKTLGSLSPEERKDCRPVAEPAQGRADRGDRGAQGRPAGRGAEPAAEDRDAGHDPAGAAGAGRPPAPDQPDHRRDRRDLRRDGLRGRGRPGHRGRFQQLHRAQHPARPSGAADAGHLLPARRSRARRRRWCCAPTPRRCRSAP